MHEKYTTRGFVLQTSAYREADKIISIYTEDFGLVSAVAAGVRRSASKLRYHTQDFSVRRFSLVRGRDLWRLVGAEEIADVIGIDPKTSSESLAVYARVLSLIRRLVKGQEKNERVFLTLFSLYKLLAQTSKSKEQKVNSKDKEKIGIDEKIRNSYIDISALETLAVFLILHALGYIKSDATTEALIVPLKINSQLVIAAKPLVSSMISAINKGLTESHL